MTSANVEGGRPRLRVHLEDPEPAKRPQLEELPQLPALCRAFERATGWPLRSASSDRDLSRYLWARRIGASEGDGATALALATPRGAPGATRSARSAFADTRDLAAAVADLLDELDRTRCALWQREAELAAGIPVSHRLNDRSHLAARLEAVLKAAAEAVGCQAAAAYMLDDATKELKLRACFGLPKSRLIDPPRPLRGAAADLEALVGHAVVLEDTRYGEHWKVPEEFAAAACVPISSPSTPLGTLWVFSGHPRPFSQHETNLLEIVAGRIASDLEREVLLGQTVQSSKIIRQLTHGADWQRSRLPTIKPLLDGWQLAGWTAQADLLGGDFHDWFVLPDGSLAVAVGDAQGKMFEAALTSATLHTALKSHACYRHTASEMLDRINQAFWAASSGGQFASAFYAVIRPESGRLECSAAGTVDVAIANDHALRRLASEDREPLGVDPDAEFESACEALAPGEVLVAMTEGVQRVLKAAGRRRLWRTIQRNAKCSAEELVEKVRWSLQHHGEPSLPDDCTVLVVKRTSA